MSISAAQSKAVVLMPIPERPTRASGYIFSPHLTSVRSARGALLTRFGSEATCGAVPIRRPAVPLKAAEAAGALVPAFLAVQESVAGLCALLADDAGQNPNNPLWKVGAAKLAFVGLLYLLFRVLQPMLDKYVANREAAQESTQQLSLEGMLNTMEENKKTTSGYLVALLKAVQISTRRLLPLILVLLLVSNLSDFIEDILFVNRESVVGFAAKVLHSISHCLTSVDYILEKATSLLAVAVGVQFGQEFTNKGVAEFLASRAATGRNNQRSLSQAVVTLSQVMGFLIYAVGAITALGVVGIDIRPLMAVGGVSGLAIGLGAKNLTSSLLAGLQLLISNPFQAGDVVELQKGGRTVMVTLCHDKGGRTVMLGKVDQVSPFRTTFVSLTDKKVPWTIPNGDIMRLSISNRSRINSTDGSDLLAEFKEVRKLHVNVAVNLPKDREVGDVLQQVSDDLETTINGLQSTAPGVPVTVEWQSIKGGSVSYDIVTFLDTLPGNYEKEKNLALCKLDEQLQKLGCKLSGVKTLA
eukprot:CAMPEP_0117670234 /NCGR_PEP_ID=MMETSP0804-20121206/12624_1 /TAXON_ID=1074897 /ORGANISM="Tetraselmis astigmatica, Strain CCMP880" /LENGTH=525 /DNA_ID=CAMNT_0005478479 /DNA_START=138 /DNA_END=1715 /DNA_ORIENTATION=+